MKPVQKSVLLSTSGRGDVTYSNGTYNIAGETFRKNLIRSVRHIKYKAEVKQVVTVGGVNANSGARYTPTASTTYTVEVFDPRRKTNGQTQGVIKFSYTTPPVITSLGSTAALQREAINVKLVAAINAATNVVSATAATLGSGNGFTITDNGSYYPPRTQGGPLNYGANTFEWRTNADGTGFVSGDMVLTTAAVYSFGVGANLVADVAVIDGMFGNFVSGLPAGIAMYNFPAPINSTGAAAATSGQNYDGFLVECFEPVAAHNVTGQLALNLKQVMILVDNGTGTSTSNLQGFIDFEKEMHKIISDANLDSSAIGEFFDSVGVFQGPSGAVPSGTSTDTNIIATEYGQYGEYVIGTSTAKIPTPTTYGYNIELDATATEGLEIAPSLQTGASKEYTVGKDDFSLYAKVYLTTVANIKLDIGFRKKEAYNGTFSSYTALASAEFNGGTITTNGKLSGGSLTATASSTTVTDGTWHDVYITVTKNGTVTVKVDNVAYTVNSAASTAMVFAANTVVVPFIRNTNLNSSAGAPVVSQWIVNENVSWIY